MATVYERSFVSHCTIEKSLRVILEADQIGRASCRERV